MSKKPSIERIYGDGPISITRGLLTGKVYFNVHDVKKVIFGKAKKNVGPEHESYWTRILLITFSNYKHNDKLETIEITMFTDDPSSVKAS